MSDGLAAFPAGIRSLKAVLSATFSFSVALRISEGAAGAHAVLLRAVLLAEIQVWHFGLAFKVSGARNIALLVCHSL